MNKKIASFFCLVFILISSFFVLENYLTPALADADGTMAKRSADEILVKFKGIDEIQRIVIAQERDFDRILGDYSRDPDVEYAEPNYLYDISIIPTDTYLNNQWYLDKIKAIKAWDKVRESPRAIIAIMDSGVQISHPDLRDNIWVNPDEVKNDKSDNDNNGFVDDMNGWDFVNNVADPSPKFKTGYTEAGVLHGTVVAGVAAASGNNAAGISGVTWKTQIMALKILDDKGEGSTLNVIKGIDYAISKGATIINFSFVGFGYSKSLDDAIKRAYDAGIIIVAAAGNEQSNGNGYSLDQTPMYPVCYDGVDENRVIGVAATDTLDQKAPFSSYGFNCVDVAAPGMGIFSTVVYSPETMIGSDRFLNKYYDGYWSGTSMATPIVSAAISLIEAANPSLNRREVLDILFSTSDKINKLNPSYLNQLGEGRINVLSAVSEAESLLAGKFTRLLVTPLAGGNGSLKFTDEDGRVYKEFMTYGENFRGGVNMASGHVTGKEAAEIATVPSSGSPAEVKIFDVSGELIKSFFAYDKRFRGGASIALGDVNGDGIDEIITGAGAGGGPHVKVFSSKGELLGQFYAYDKYFRGGVNVAAGDVDGDGVAEIVTGAGPGGGPQVRIFSMKGRLFSQFFAFDKRFRGGVRVAVGDVDGGTRANRAEIITAPGPGGGPQVRIFSNKAELVNQFFAYNSNFRGGVQVAAGDMDNDGLVEIVTGAGAGGAPHVRVFTASGALAGSYYAYEDKFSGGVNVSAIHAEESAIRQAWPDNGSASTNFQ